MADAQRIVEDDIENSKVVIFSKSYCPYCKKAKTLLDRLKIKYVAIELDLHPHGEDIQSYLYDKTGQRTVPNIFINQKHIGGPDDLAKVEEDGSLEKLLA